MKRLLRKRTSFQDSSTSPHPTTTSPAHLSSPPLASPARQTRPSLDSQMGRDFGVWEVEPRGRTNVPPSSYNMGAAGGRPWGLTRLKSWKGKKRDPSPGPGGRSPTKLVPQDEAVPKLPTSPTKVTSPENIVKPMLVPSSPEIGLDTPQTPLHPSLSQSAPTSHSSTPLSSSSEAALIPPTSSPVRPTLHRKLTKRRPKSSSEAFELVTRGNFSELPPLDTSPPRLALAGALDAEERPIAIAEALHPASSSSSLNRNNTTSTASSNAGPATEESLILDTPGGVMLVSNRGTFGHIWDQPTTLSRSSTLSFREGDDGLLRVKPPPLSSAGEQTFDRPVPLDLPESPNGSVVASSHVTTDSTSTTTPGSYFTSTHTRLRVATSNLSAERSDSNLPSRRSVAFDVAHSLNAESATRRRGESRASRPSYTRSRSSSLGDISCTTSMYSLGDIQVATRTVHASPTTLRLEEALATTIAPLPAHPSGLVPLTQSSLDAMPTVDGVELWRSRSYDTRPPPPPPHLTARLAPTGPTPRISSDTQRDTPAPKRPTPQRQGSLSRLWRKLSSSRGRSPKEESEEVPPVPPRLSPQQKEFARKSSRLPVSRPSAEGGRTRKISISRETTRMKSSIAPVPRPRTSSLSATSRQAGRATGRTPRLDTSPRSALPILAPVTAEPEHFVAEITPPTPLLPESFQSARKRYRQSLVEIRDDALFQRVLEDLARIGENIDHTGLHEGLEEGMMLMRTKSRELLERQARKDGIQAWFVAREIIQGERRYGKLLAKGVSLVQNAFPSDTAPPSSSPDSTHKPKVPPKSPARRPVRLSSPPSMSPIINAPPPTHGFALLSANPSALSVLRTHLPRILALSNHLSCQCELDPSPSGIADAFLGVAGDLEREIGMWAGQVGTLIATGLGELLDQHIAISRHASSINLQDVGEEERRLGFGDIIILPIQRAARYQLLFQELLNKSSPGDAHDKIAEALRAAERLAEECDRKQTFDLSSLRRSSQLSSSSTSEVDLAGSRGGNRSSRDLKGKSTSRSRPKSMVVTPSRRTSWLSAA